jgi:hypothetical protein
MDALSPSFFADSGLLFSPLPMIPKATRSSFMPSIDARRADRENKGKIPLASKSYAPPGGFLCQDDRGTLSGDLLTLHFRHKFTQAHPVPETANQ